MELHLPSNVRLQCSIQTTFIDFLFTLTCILPRILLIFGLHGAIQMGFVIVTFCVSRRRRKMYCGHARLCVSLCVCLSAAVCAVRTLLHGHGCNLGEWYGLPSSCALLPLVVHYWADLQSVHGLRSYGNITRTRDMIT